MCLIVFAWQAHAEHGARLTLAANRDEFYARPSAPLGWWDDAPEVLAGRDLQGRGTWLGITRGGRFAALTNFRAPAAVRADAPSRGALVSDFLRGQVTANQYLAEVAQQAGRYNGFNLLLGELAQGELYWFSNRASALYPHGRRLPDGCYGLSNALLDTPWPKVVSRTTALRVCLEAHTNDPSAQNEALLELMQDRTVARDTALPHTGLSLARERAVSAAYIALPDYGTRCTTVLRVGADATVAITELGDSGPDGQRVAAPLQRRTFHFDIAMPMASAASSRDALRGKALG